METFHWKIKPGMTVNSEPRVTAVKYGDGYEQRKPAGINTDLKKYGVTFSVTRDDARYLEGFLARHGGYKAFLWTPPYLYRPIKVVCRKWSNTVNARRVDYNAEFEQVIA